MGKWGGVVGHPLAIGLPAACSPICPVLFNKKRCNFKKTNKMPAVVNRNKPSALASIIMELEPLPENEKLQMLDAIRKRKLVLAAYKLDQKTKKNAISMNEIVAEVKKVRKLRNRNGAK